MKTKPISGYTVVTKTRDGDEWEDAEGLKDFEYFKSFDDAQDAAMRRHSQRGGLVVVYSNRDEKQVFRIGTL